MLVVGGGGVGGGRGVVEVEVVWGVVVRKRSWVGREVLLEISFKSSFSFLCDNVFCCNLFHQGMVVLARFL